MWLVPFVESTESSKVPARPHVFVSLRRASLMETPETVTKMTQFTVMLRHTWLQNSREDQRYAELAARHTQIKHKEEDEDQNLMVRC